MISSINEFKKYLNTKVINEGSGNAKIRYNGQFWPTYYIEYYDSTDEEGNEIPYANDMFIDDFIGNVEHFKSVKLTRVADKWIDNNQVIKFESDTFKVVVVDNEWALGVGVIPAFYDENDEGEEVIPNGFNEDATKFFNELNSIYKLHTATSAWTSRAIDNDEKITVNENVAEHIKNESNNNNIIIKTPKQLINIIIKDNINFKWLKEYNITTFNKLEKILQESGYGPLYHEYIIKYKIDDTNINENVAEHIKIVTANYYIGNAKIMGYIYESNPTQITILRSFEMTPKDSESYKIDNFSNIELATPGDFEYFRVQMAQYDRPEYIWNRQTTESKITLQQDAHDKIKVTLDEEVILKHAKKMFKNIKTMKDVKSLGTSNYDKLIKELSKINESSINERFTLPDGMVKALDDIDERRPNRMKRPGMMRHDFAGRGGQRGYVYIQDEAEEVMQDKYGRERGTKLWRASINASQSGAMFKMADDVMKEKAWLMHEMNVYPSEYWDVSYYSLWKAWMNKQGLTYKIDSDEDIQAKADAKRAAEEAEEKAQFDRKLNQIESDNTTAGLPTVQPDAKDKQRVADMFRRDNWPTTAANTMANAIKDVNKAVRRGQAVLDYIKDNNLSYFKLDIAEIFFNKAKLLLRRNENINSVLEHLSDENNPIFMLQNIPNELLINIINNNIDIKELAIQELKNRGYNEIGKYIGFVNNEDYDASIPFEDEDLYHNIDWIDMESKFTQFTSTYPKEQYASMRQTFNFLKEEILKYKMTN